MTFQEIYCVDCGRPLELCDIASGDDDLIAVGERCLQCTHCAAEYEAWLSQMYSERIVDVFDYHLHYVCIAQSLQDDDDIPY
jgi:hypothetical protein